MENYASNSRKSKETTSEQPKRKAEKVVQGSVKTKRKSNSQRLADTFLSEDLGNVKDYVLFDVLVPLIKKTVHEVSTKTIDMILFGETSRSDKSTPASRVSYGGCFKRDERPRPTTRTRTSYSYDDVIFETRVDAEDVLSSMDETIRQYGTVRLADMYDLSGMDSRWTDNNYGWADISTARIERISVGYIIRFPKISPLN